MKKVKKTVIFGTSTFAEIVEFYLENDSNYRVDAFCSTDPEKDSYLEKPLVSFSKIENLYPPHEYDMFVAIGYRKMNALRRRYCEEAREKGYRLLSYISSKATYWGKANKIGDNVFIFENNTIQPFVEIGDGTILWSGNHIGHHSKIGKYCFISSHVVISGDCTVDECCFIGVNSTVSDSVKISEKNLIGACCLIAKDTNPCEVYVGEKSKPIKVSSENFFK